MGLDDLSTGQKVALAITIPTSLLFLYLLLRKRDEEEYLHPSNDLATGQFLMIEMKIPAKMVGTVIGREGSKIKQIQEESGARVRFQDETGLKEEEDRIVIIRGNPENAMQAEQLLNKLLSDQPVIDTVEMLVPQRAVGRVIGKGGENIRQLCRCSGAKIFIERSEGKRDPNTKRLCYIKGTIDQIRTAQTMIEEEIQQEAEYQQKLELAGQNRRQRKPVKQEGQTTTATVQNSAPNPSNNNQVQESPSASNIVQLPTHPNYFTIYVSAVEHPGHFWFQMITPKARHFDLLVETMTEFYRQRRNQEEHRPEGLNTGDIVAATFQGDDLWYRARVLGFLEDNNVDLYYVDYGDCGQVPRADVFSLRSDYLSMPFQAIEASLSGAIPKDDKWSEAAIDLFEESTYCAQWKPLMARIVSYNQSSQPCVELIDTNGSNDKIILEELISRGHALNPTSSKVPETPPSPSRTRTSPEMTEPKMSPARTVQGAGASSSLQNNGVTQSGGYPMSYGTGTG